jgi:hypothetical protein
MEPRNERITRHGNGQQHYLPLSLIFFSFSLTQEASSSLNSSFPLAGDVFIYGSDCFAGFHEYRNSNNFLWQPAQTVPSSNCRSRLLIHLQGAGVIIHARTEFF